MLLYVLCGCELVVYGCVVWCDVGECGCCDV